MAGKRFDAKFIQVRQARFLPQNLSREPNDPQDLIIQPGINTTITNLFGQTSEGGRLVDATPYGSLQVASTGVAFRNYDTKADTAPATFSALHQLVAPSGTWHQFDILIESQEAIIRFLLADSGSWGDSIPLTVGNHSIAFESTTIQIAKRGDTAGTYTIIAWQ